MAIEMVEQRPGYGPPTPVPIFQWEREFENLLALYKWLQPKRVLEVGTYHGGTLYHWLQNGQPDLVVTVDSYGVGIDNRWMYLDWVRDGTELVIVDGDSRNENTVAQAEKHAPYDWVFVDAGHYYQEVRADWDNYGPLAKEGGIVCFHDILPPNDVHPEIEVAQLWEQIKQEHNTFEIVANRHALWGGIGVVLL